MGSLYTRVAMCGTCGSSLSVPFTVQQITCASCGAVLDVGPPSATGDPGWVPCPSGEEGAVDLGLGDDVVAVDVMMATGESSFPGSGRGRIESGESGSNTRREEGGDGGDPEESQEGSARRVTFGQVTRHRWSADTVGLTELQARTALARYIKTTKMRKRNFAEAIHIDGIERVGAFAVFLESFVEYRKVEPAMRPAGQQSHGISADPSASPWMLDVVRPQSFQAFHELRVPIVHTPSDSSRDSSRTRPHPEVCHPCRGSGQVVCAWCEGEGIDYELHNACSRCAQEGHLECLDCQGSGSVVPGVDLVTMWQTPRFERAFVPGQNSMLAEKLPIDQLILLSSWVPPVYMMQRARALSTEDVDPSLPVAVKNLVSEVLRTSPSVAPAEARLLAQRLTVRPMPIFKVHYHPNKEFYVFGGGRGSSLLSTASQHTAENSPVGMEQMAKPPPLRRSRAWYGVIAPNVPIDRSRLIMGFVCVVLLLLLIVFSFILS